MIQGLSKGLKVGQDWRILNGISISKRFRDIRWSQSFLQGKNVSCAHFFSIFWKQVQGCYSVGVRWRTCVIVIILACSLFPQTAIARRLPDLLSDQPWVQRQAAPAAPATQGRLSGTSYISLFPFWDTPKTFKELPYEYFFAAVWSMFPELGCCASHWPLTAAPASTARGVWRWTLMLLAPSHSGTTPTLMKRLMR